MEVNGQLYASWYPLDRMLDGLRAGLDSVVKRRNLIIAYVGNWVPVVQLEPSHYTDWAIPSLPRDVAVII
jgi:hypothetical protein